MKLFVVLLAIAFHLNSQAQDQNKNLIINCGCRDSTKKPLIVLDGKILSSKPLDSIKPNDIERVDVFKDSSLTKVYGEKARHGVIFIYTKQKVKSEALAPAKNLNSSEPTLYNIDGQMQDTVDSRDEKFLKVYNDGHISIIETRDIEEINVVTDASEQDKYGPGGSNGVVLITRKKKK